MDRKNDKLMVRVYMAEFPDTKGRPGMQSKWAHRLLDAALKREYPKLCEPVFTDRDGNGKPFLPGYPQIQFNLSHSGCYAACAIGEKTVGIDVECWKNRKGRDRVAERFHPLEREAYREAEDEERESLFHELWVLKESFMKADGRGLRIPLDSFYMEGICRETGKVWQEQNEKSYYYKLYRTEGAFSLAVCSEERLFAEKPVWIELRNSSN